ncbi:MAG: hypothetical protein KatS3mg101_0389 [Patescibacteria group bacterium]|nr:MAG: hypothetical protein KatS3mg101_0389 [Patescibacteria group bacterium]
MILNVYKPKNWTSFDVVAKIRGVLKVKKAGHAGTLDPLAEGVLIVLTGEDTKRQAEFMKLEKEYIAKIAFGAGSPTYDLEVAPTLVAKMPPAEVYKKLQEILSDFVGEIDQVVPSYSAKKIEGKEMYKMVRKGAEVPVVKKRVAINSIEIVENGICTIWTNAGLMELPCSTMKVQCSSGTYVRSLAYEMGRKIGTGGVLVSLLRSAVGEYRVENSVKIEDLFSQLSL